MNYNDACLIFSLVLTTMPKLPSNFNYLIIF